MQIKSILYYVCISLILANIYSCTPKNDMEVLYVDDALGECLDIEPKRFIEHFNGKMLKTVIVPQSEFDSIYNGFKNTRYKKRWEPECRFCLTTSIGQVFIDHKFDAFTVDSDSVSVDPRIVYLLRKYCGFYNGIEKDELQYLYDSHYFNLLQDYEYAPPPQNATRPIWNLFVRVRLHREE
jgi:hypothetical protein